jgi:hypothetical protein
MSSPGHQKDIESIDSLAAWQEAIQGENYKEYVHIKGMISACISNFNLLIKKYRDNPDRLKTPDKYESCYETAIQIIKSINTIAENNPYRRRQLKKPS